MNHSPASSTQAPSDRCFGPVAIILAAGHGKRMKSNKAKVLHEVCGRPMIHYVVDAVRQAGVRRIVVVVGFAADQVRAALADQPDVEFVLQEQQRGTGDAVKACRALLADHDGPALVVVGDEPLLRPEPLAALLERQAREGFACLMGTAVVSDPTGFGRILRDGAGRFLRIVEERDCDSREAAIREINPSCYVFALPHLWTALDRLTTNNAQGEYYLTDAPTLLQEMGLKVEAQPALEPDDVLGINTRAHLAEAHMVMQRRIHNRLMEEGVGIVDPRNTSIDARASIGRDTVIHPFTVITGRVRIGVECSIGPFALVRDGVTLGDRVSVGAFVELTRSDLGDGVAVRHLSYLGDAQVGALVNIGAGTITANYDGRAKHPTRIGAGAFVGAGAILVAPAEVGERAVVGAGAVLPPGRVVEPGQTVVGVPARPLDRSQRSATDPR